MRSPGLRQFFYRKKKIIFLGPFFFKFAVHYLRNGPEDFGSDDIYEVPRPQTIFVYIYKKIFLGPFFSNSAIMDMIRAPLSKQTSCTSTRDCSINIESTNLNFPDTRPRILYKCRIGCIMKYHIVLKRSFCPPNQKYRTLHVLDDHVQPTT